MACLNYLMKHTLHFLCISLENQRRNLHASRQKVFKFSYKFVFVSSSKLNVNIIGDSLQTFSDKKTGDMVSEVAFSHQSASIKSLQKNPLKN